MSSVGTLKKVGWTLVVLSSAALLIPAFGEYYASDMCLDAGNVYDYATSQCRADVDHLPYMPYLGRAEWPQLFAVVGLGLGVLCTLAGYRRPG